MLIFVTFAKVIKHLNNQYYDNKKKSPEELRENKLLNRACREVPGFREQLMRIRHYGILSGTWKKERLPKLQRQLGVRLQSPNHEKETWLRRYPHCKTGTLITIMTFFWDAHHRESIFADNSPFPA